MNLYAYCANNPVYYVDPSGNECRPAKDRVEAGSETAKNTVKEPSKLAEHQKNRGTDGKSNAPKGYYKDANGRWHRPNGQFASNTEVGLTESRSKGSNKRSGSSNTKGGSGTTNGGSNLTGVTYEGTIYRSVNSAYNPLEMNDYTIQSNHRYTKKGTPGLYFSSGEKIVKAELGNYDVTDFSNRTMYSYDVKLDNMLDVSNPNIRNQLGMSLDSIIGDSYDVTHSIGEFAYSSGYNGIIAPSARADGGVNVIVFDPKIIN
ncbi:RES domain-containing protein [Anaerocolumna jejuensis]|uniref:RES family NAD+ phosphorylase n=1 Tax=Anaerocolumna jejuensis TaxID=259063 RepID=UPI003F7B68D7